MPHIDRPEVRKPAGPVVQPKAAISDLYIPADHAIFAP